MQVPIFEGIGVDLTGDYRTSYPVNAYPVAKKTGISDAYLRLAEGVTQWAVGTGRGRGGIWWSNTEFRACGSRLVSINSLGQVTDLGFIGDDGRDCSFTYSFDRLAVASAGVLYYWQGPGGANPGLTSLTDVDAGYVAFVKWVDGYFVLTDGQTIAVTELTDPYTVNPLKYGSAEESPDVINGLLHISSQLIAVGRLTNEYFQNIGGDLFPFQRLPNALIEKGAIGNFAFAMYNQTYLFVGSGFNEAPAVYLGGSGLALKVSTREIETLIKEAGGESVLQSIIVEVRAGQGVNLAYIHLPTKTLVYDIEATATLGKPVWFILTSGVDGSLPYRCRHWVWAFDAWHCDDLQSSNFGALDTTRTTQYGQRVPFQVDTYFAFNEGKGAQIHLVELHHNPGALGSTAAYTLSWTDDGRTWAMPRRAAPVFPGDIGKRAMWPQCGLMRSQRALRIAGTNDVPDAFATLSVQLEPFGV